MARRGKAIVQTALKKARQHAALGGSIGPVPKSNRITGEFRNPEERPHGQPYLRPWYMSPRKTEEAAGTRREDTRPPIVPRIHSIASRADGGPVDEFSGLDPIERDKIRLAGRGTVGGRELMPDELAQNGLDTIHAAFGMAPGTGNAMAAADAYGSGREMFKEGRKGNVGRALLRAGETGLNALGAITGIPGLRMTGPAASEAMSSARIFAGPTAKTADRAALVRAEEMQKAGADRADIWRETGWFQGAEGKWRFEIDDSASRMTDDAADLVSGKLGTTHGGAKAYGVIEHPEFYDAYPDAAKGWITVKQGKGTGSFDDVYGDIEIAPSTPKEGRNIALHEFQHRVQKDEGFAPGGDMFASVAGHDAFWAEKSRLFEQMMNDPKLAGIIDEAGMFNLAHARAKQNLNRDWYTRNAGEVEARNVEARADMSAAERRAAPPWTTQDVPEADVRVNDKTPGAPQNVFVPAQPSKTSDLAREMRLNDVPNRQIFKQTNRFFGPDGRLRAEVPDKPMAVKRLDMQPGDTAPMGDVVGHPSLFGVHPEMRDIPVKFTDPTNARGHPIARTGREGGYEISAGRDEDFYREQFAKLLNYQTGQKGGFGGAVLHDVHDQFKAYDDALRIAESIAANPKPGDDVAAALAYIERIRPMHQQLAEGVGAYGGVRDIARKGGPAGIDETMEMTRLRGLTEDATRNANRSTAGNLESRLVRERAHREVSGGPNSLSRYPYEQGVRLGDVGENWSKAQVLPNRGMDRDDTARLIEDWAKYGIGNPRKFARGGRVKAALKKAHKVLLGAVRGKTTGRSDKLAVSVPPGSYVIPADVVAALGDGNSEAGLAKLESQFKPRKAGYAAGGAVPIQISDGEFVIDPAAVAALGGGDAKYGHDVLDQFVLQTRGAYADHLKNLPGPNV